MYIVSFNAMYAENSIILANRLGIQFVQDMNPKQNDIIIVFGAKECADKLLMIQQQLNVEYIIIQTEQFYGKGFDNKYYLDLVQKNSVLDWSKENVKKLKKFLPNTPFYSLYFYDYLINNDLPHFNTRPIDFFFYGSENKEIEKTLKDFKMSNLDYNVEYDLTVRELSATGTQLSSNFISGKDSPVATFGDEIPFDYQIGQTIGGTSEVITLAAKATSNNDDLAFTLEWYDLT